MVDFRALGAEFEREWEEKNRPENRLLEAAEKRGFTKKALAAFLRIDRDRLRRILGRQVEITVREAAAIEDEFNIKMRAWADSCADTRTADDDPVDETS
jgi:ribosome-binding protein aMBF1 (putative translation factor)